MGGAIHAAAWIENADAFDDWDSAGFRTNTSVGVIVDMIVGPVARAGSAGFDGRWRTTSRRPDRRAEVVALWDAWRRQPRKIRQSLAQQYQLIAFAQRSRFSANRVEHHRFAAIQPDEKARFKSRAIGQEHVCR